MRELPLQIKLAIPQDLAAKVGTLNESSLSGRMSFK
jgi:hypothetical protein